MQDDQLQNTEHSSEANSTPLPGHYPSQRRVRLILILSFSLVLIVAGLFALNRFFPQYSPLKKLQKLARDEKIPAEIRYELEAEKQDEIGIEPNTSFILSAPAGVKLSEDYLRQNLKVAPVFDYELKIRRGKAVIKPEKPLEEGALYRFSLTAKDERLGSYLQSWSFQVKGDLDIIATYPRAYSSNIPVSSTIEIYFNRLDFPFDEKFFEITPNIPGKWRKILDRAVFLPQQPLDKGKTYTVRVKKGLGNDKTGYLKEDFSFYFYTEFSDADRNQMNFVREVLNIKPGSEIVIPGYFDSRLVGRSVKADLIRIKPEDFRQCILLLSNFPGQKITSCNLQGDTVDSADVVLESTYVRLPQRLEKGYYLLRFLSGGQEIGRVLLNAINIAASYWIGVDDSFFWVNDLGSGNGVGGAEIRINGSLLGKTDNQGILQVATLPNLRLQSDNLLEVAAGGERLSILLEESIFAGPFSLRSSVLSESVISKQKDYWNYLYLDRKFYEPADQLGFWGVFKPRADAEPVKSLIVNISDTSLGFSGAGSGKYSLVPPPIFSQKVELGESSTFKGIFEWDNLPVGDYIVWIADSKDPYIPIRSEYFTISNKIRRQADLQVDFDRLGVIKGEKIKVRVKTTFYDGTAFPNAPVEIESAQITTDSRGLYEYTIDTSQIDLMGNPSRIKSYFFRLIDDFSYATVNVFIYQGELYPVIESKSEKDNLEVKIQWFRVDKRKLLDDPALAWEGNPAGGQEFEIKLEKVNWVREDAGEEYDPWSKKVVKRYIWREVREQIQQQTLKTDKNGVSLVRIPAEKDQIYRVSISAQDPAGRIVEQVSYLSYLSPRENIFNRFIRIESNKEKYNVGESVILSAYSELDENRKTTLPEGKGIFLITGRGKIYEKSSILRSGVYNTKFRQDWIPSAYAQAIWFTKDGYLVSGKFLSLKAIYFDQDLKRSKLSIIPERQAAAPGDKVKIRVKVDSPSRRENTVLISVVDSRIVGLNIPEFLDNLYTPVINGDIYFDASILYSRVADEGGGGGKVGDDAVRSYFKNTVFFEEVQTDNQGNAEVEIKLPDNITKWQITALSVNSELEVGEAQSFVYTDLPLVVNLVGGRRFNQGDKPVIQVYADLKPRIGGDINFIAEIKSLNYRQEKKAGPFRLVEFSLPEFSRAGEYDIVISASIAGYSDAVKEKIIVSPIQTTKTTSVGLVLREKTLVKEKLADIRDNSAIRITLADRGKAYFYPKLQCLSSYCLRNLERLDSILAQKISLELLGNYFGEPAEDASFDLPSYEDKNSGFLSIFPEQAGIPELTAKAAASGERLLYIQSDAFRKYARDLGDIEKISLSVWGLAEIGESSKSLIRSLADKDNTTRGRIYLALAASKVGDPESVNKLLNFGVKDEAGFRYLSIVSDPEENKYLNSLAMIALARVGEYDLALDIEDWLAENPPKNIPVVLERALMIKAIFENSLPEITNLEYNPRGTTQRIRFDPKDGRLLSLQVYPDVLDQFFVNPLDNPVGLVVEYEQEVDQGSMAGNINLNVDVNNPQPEVGSVVEIILRPDLAAGKSENYLIKATLPSGLRFLNLVREDPIDFSYRLISAKDGVVKIRVQKNKQTPIRIRSYAIMRGEYVFPPVIIYSGSEWRVVQGVEKVIIR